MLPPNSMPNQKPMVSSNMPKFRRPAGGVQQGATSLDATPPAEEPVLPSLKEEPPPAAAEPEIQPPPETSMVNRRPLPKQVARPTQPIQPKQSVQQPLP